MEFLVHAQHIPEILAIVICPLYKLIIIFQKCAPQSYIIPDCHEIIGVC